MIIRQGDNIVVHFSISETISEAKNFAIVVLMFSLVVALIW